MAFFKFPDPAPTCPASVRDDVPPIELVDGEKLVGMLENPQLGLRPVRAFEANEEVLSEFSA